MLLLVVVLSLFGRPFLFVDTVDSAHDLQLCNYFGHRELSLVFYFVNQVFYFLQYIYTGRKYDNIGRQNLDSFYRPFRRGSILASDMDKLLLSG